jgi:hypothetical protein
MLFALGIWEFGPREFCVWGSKPKPKLMEDWGNKWNYWENWMGHNPQIFMLNGTAQISGYGSFLNS